MPRPTGAGAGLIWYKKFGLGGSGLGLGVSNPNGVTPPGLGFGLPRTLTQTRKVRASYNMRKLKR